jgi:hypothetical protein
MIKEKDIDTIITFGDSWPSGCELDLQKEKPYGKILAEKLNCEFENLAVGASSIDHMVWQLKNYATKKQISKNTLAIFFITSFHRFLYFQNAYPSEGMPRSDNVVSKMFYKYIYSEELAQHRANSSILAIQNICNHFQIHHRYIYGWEKPDLNYPGIEKDLIHPDLVCNWINVDSSDLVLGRQGATIINNPYMAPNIDHPNQLGHKLIADKLYKWIFE